MSAFAQSESRHCFSDKEPGKRVHKGAERVPIRLLHGKGLQEGGKRNMARVRNPEKL